VQATDAAGSSALSSAVSGIPNAIPAKPTGLAVSIDSPTSLSITWNASSGASSYQLFRDSSSTGSFTTKVYDGSATSYANTGLTTGTAYYYEVQATNSAGSSALSSAVSGTPLAVPATPTGLSVSIASSTSLAVSWNASASAATYQVFRDTSSTGSFSTKVYDGSLTSYTNTSLTAGTTYYYEVQATNSAGSSALSTAVLGIPNAIPAKPTGLAVSIDSPTSLSITLYTASGASSYQLFRDTTASGSFPTKNFDASATSYTDTGLSAGTTYYYKVQATNSAGSSALSSAVAGIPNAMPATPTGLAVAIATSTSLSITWNSSASAATYQVFRDTSSTGSYSTKVYDGSLTSYTNTGLTAGSIYYYKVQATNSAGSSTLSSAVAGIPNAIPAKPTGLAVVSATTTSLSITWNASSGTSSYQLFRDTSSTGSFSTKVFDAAGTSYTDTGLATGATYFYKLQATNSAGSSALSAAVSGTTELPGAVWDNFNWDAALWQ